MKELAREFFEGSKNDTRPFFLYIGFFDPHRCDPQGKQGKFKTVTTVLEFTVSKFSHDFSLR